MDDDPRQPPDASSGDAAAFRSRRSAAAQALVIPRGARPRSGVFDPRRVRLVSFATISLSLFGAAVFCILSVWNYVHHDVGWRAIATLVIVIATMAAFMLVNEFFGASLPPPATSPSSGGGGLP